MDYNLIGLIITGIIALFLVGSVIVGLIRGFKKNLVYGIINIAIIVLLFIFIKSITNALINLDISFLNININGEQITSLNQLILTLLKDVPTINNLIASNEGAEIVTSLPLLIATPFVFTICYWLIKVVEFIISLIVGLIGLITKPFRKKKLDARGKVIKPKKHRLAGALVGLVSGLLITLATFTPLFGVAGIFKDLNTTSSSNNDVSPYTIVLHADDNTKEKTLLEELFGEEAVKILNAYNNSIGINIAQITGMEALGKTAFNGLASTTINNEELKLVDEIKSITTVVKDYFTISEYFNKETLTQEETTLLLSKIKGFVNNVFNVKTLKVIGNFVIPEIIDDILNNPDSDIKLPENITEDQISNMITTALLKELENAPVDEIKVILLDIIGVLELLDENKILMPLYNSIKTGEELSYGDYYRLVLSTNDTFANDISEIVTELNIIKNMSPTFVDSALTMLFTNFNLTYETNNISKENATNTLNAVLVNAINLIKTLDPNSSLYVTQNSFINIGNILNITKDTNVLTTEQYNSLVIEIENELKKYETPINLNNVINNLSEVTSWSNEANKLGLIFNDFKDFYDNVLIKENIDITKIDFTKLGTMFNNLEETTIFNGAVKDLYNEILTTVAQNPSLQNYSNVFNTLKINETEVNWEKELTSIKPLITTILNVEDISFSEEPESLLQILDIIDAFDLVEQDENSVVYSTKMETLLKEVLNVLKTNVNNNMLTDVSNKIVARINNRTSETLKVCVLKGIFDYSTTLIPDASSFSDENIGAMIAEIKTNITNANNNVITIDYEEELNYILSFAKQVNTLQNFENLTDEEITEMAEFLDSLSESKIFTNAKTHIVNYIIDTAISAISENDTYNISAQLEDLKENLTGVTISTLLEDFNTLKDVANKIKIPSDITALNTEEVANSLNSIRNTETFNNKFTNTILVKVFEDINTDIQQDTSILTPIKNEVDNYITTQIETLNNVNTTITNSIYKEMLDGLLDLFKV